VKKVMKFSVPPGYVRQNSPIRPKLDPLIPVIDAIRQAYCACEPHRCTLRNSPLTGFQSHMWLKVES
jgi:hypothetical protein